MARSLTALVIVRQLHCILACHPAQHPRGLMGLTCADMTFMCSCAMQVNTSILNLTTAEMDVWVPG
jgi:hypothetical protein